MPLSVTDALRDGLGRTFERNGLQLVGVFVVVRLLSTIATSTLNRANLTVAEEMGALPSDFTAGPFGGLADAPTPFALGIGLAGAYLLFVGVALLAEAARIVAVRTMVSDRTDAIPMADARRNLGAATINGFVGGIVVYTVSGLGLVFFVLPGLFLLVSFLFVRQEIAIRDVNFVEAMGGAWNLSAGHRLQLFALVVALFLVSVIGGVPGLVFGSLSPAMGSVVGAMVQAFVVVFGIASVSRAYVQLRDGGEAGEDADRDPYEGALTADDLPEPGSRDRP